MKLYTLNYNCNVPTTQQINVPTNTDYKVGIKVTRNGKEQNLKPAEVKLYTGKSNGEYISPDDGLTNGYMTFTRSTEDEAFGEADVIDIQHAQDSTVEIQKYTNNTGAQVSQPLLSCTAEELGIAGKTIYPEMTKMGALFAQSTEPTDAELKASADTYWNWTLRNDTPSIIFRTNPTITGNKGAIWTMAADPAGQMYKQSLLNEGLWDGVTPFFFFVPTGSQYFSVIYDYTFDGSETITLKNVKTANGKSKGGYLEFDYDYPFDAQFKLTTNAFKSQQGDLADDASTGKTTTLSGEYSDGTEFDYNIVIA